MPENSPVPCTALDSLWLHGSNFHSINSAQASAINIQTVFLPSPAPLSKLSTGDLATVRVAGAFSRCDWRPNEGLLWEGDLIRDVLELRRVVVEVADPHDHRDCLPLLGPEHRAGDLGVIIHHTAGGLGVI